MRYLKIFDEVLSKEFCNELISKFEISGGTRLDTPAFQFSQIVINDNPTIMRVYSTLSPLTRLYVKECGIESYQFPKHFEWETPRIKKYWRPSDKFSDHVDVRDQQSAKRFLSFLVYLNNAPDSPTVFFGESGNIQVEPKVGRVVVFPPLWTYPHKAAPVSDNSKYVMSTYLHYPSS